MSRGTVSSGAMSRRAQSSMHGGAGPACGPCIELTGVRLSYGLDPALRGVDLTIEAGERTAVMGPSGCGKSTLLHLLAGVLPPDSGSVRLLGEDLVALNEKQRTQLRLERIGMVFQFGDLVGELTLRENVALPLQLLGGRRGPVGRRVSEMLEQLQLTDVADRRAAEVSGGQAQRAAVARALVHEPPLVLADEPTGALDTVAADTVMEALVDMAVHQGTSLVVVTHDNRVAAHLDRLVTMRDGKVVS